MTNKTYEQDGNKSVGVYQNNNGTFTAISYSVSKDFKSFKTADKWLQKYL
jgi:hypothetical protein